MNWQDMLLQALFNVVFLAVFGIISILYFQRILGRMRDVDISGRRFVTELRSYEARRSRISSASWIGDYLVSKQDINHSKKNKYHDIRELQKWLNDANQSVVIDEIRNIKGSLEEIARITTEPYAWQGLKIDFLREWIIDFWQFWVVLFDYLNWPMSETITDRFWCGLKDDKVWLKTWEKRFKEHTKPKIARILRINEDALNLDTKNGNISIILKKQQG